MCYLILAAMVETRCSAMFDRQVLVELCRFAPGAAEDVLAAAVARRAKAPQQPEQDKKATDESRSGRKGTKAKTTEELAAEDEAYVLRRLARLHHRATLLRLLTDAQQGPDDARARAVEALSEVEDASMVVPLSKGIEMKDSRARAFATLGLLRIGTQDTLAVVRKRLVSAKDNAFVLVLDAVPSVAQRLGKPAAAELLQALLPASADKAAPAPAKEPEARPRTEIGPDDGPEPMPGRRGRRVAARKTGDDEPVQLKPMEVAPPQSVLDAVTKLEVYNQGLLDTVTGLTGHGRPDVRAATIVALARLTRFALPTEKESVGKKIQESVTKLLDDKEPQVVAAALKASAIASGKDALPALRQRITHGHPDVRVGVIDASAIVSVPPDLDIFGKGLTDKDPSVVMHALALAPSFKKRSDIVRLVRDVLETHSGSGEDADASLVPEKLAEALGRIGRPEGVATLKLLALQPWPDVKVAATRALGRIGTPETDTTLNALLDDKDAEVRETAIRALAALPSGRGIARLVKILRGDSRTSGESRPRGRDDEREPGYDEGRAKAKAPEGDIRDEIVAAALRHGTSLAFKGLLQAAPTNDLEGLERVVRLAPTHLKPGGRGNYLWFLGRYLVSADITVRTTAAQAVVAAAKGAAALKVLKSALDKDPTGLLASAAGAAETTKDRKYQTDLYRWFTLHLKKNPTTTEAVKTRSPDREAEREEPRPARTVSPDDPLLADRKAAILAIGRLGGPSSAGVLRQVYSKVSGLRGKGRGKELPAEIDSLIQAVIEAYASSGDKSAVRTIVGRYTAYGGAFKKAVVSGLARCGNLDLKAATAKLRAAMNEPETDLSALAADALDDVLNRSAK